MKQIAFVTSSSYPNGTADDQLTQAPLHALGITLDIVCWDDPTVRWLDYDAVIVRSTWGYHNRIAAFRHWLEVCESHQVNLWNSAKMMMWNSDKHYLIDLQHRNVPILPTAWVTRNRAVNMRHILESNGWNKAVVKPTISASAHNTWITDISNAERDQTKLLEMLVNGDVMVQAFAKEIIRTGEYSLMFFGGQFSHAVLKKPRAGDFKIQGGQLKRVIVPEAIMTQARAILRAVPQPPLYARVDGIIQEGKFVLMELELIEPSLFLAHDVAAPQLFAAAINAIVKASPPAHLPAPNIRIISSNHYAVD